MTFDYVSALYGRVGAHTKRTTTTVPTKPVQRCDRCGRAAVCIGADLARPKRRCPVCCRAETFGHRHGRDDFGAHAVAEGVEL